MQMVTVVGMEGKKKALALVRHTETMAFVCAPDRYDEAMADPTDQHVVGFPLANVQFDQPKTKKPSPE